MLRLFYHLLCKSNHADDHLTLLFNSHAFVLKYNPKEWQKQQTKSAIEEKMNIELFVMLSLWMAPFWQQGVVEYFSDEILPSHQSRLCSAAMLENTPNIQQKNSLHA